METVPIEALEERLSEIARRVENGETVVVTREGRPVLELVPHSATVAMTGGDPLKQTIGLDFEALAAYKRARGIEKIVTYIAPDFDDPLPEDFLLQPLPEHMVRPARK